MPANYSISPQGAVDAGRRGAGRKWSGAGACPAIGRDECGAGAERPRRACRRTGQRRRVLNGIKGRRTGPRLFSCVRLFMTIALRRSKLRLSYSVRPRR